MKGLHTVSWILLVVGGLNWLLIGFGGETWNVVAKLGDTVATIVYVVVGLAALVEIFTHKKNCSCCSSSGSTTPTQGM